MAKVIEAKAIISAEDKTGAALKSVADKFDALSKAGKKIGAGMSESLTAARAQIDKFSEQLDKVQGFKKLHEGLTASRQKLRETQTEVQRLGAAMRSAEAPTSQLTRQYERAQRAVSLASAAFEKQRSAVSGARSELAGMGIAIDRLASSEARLKSAIDQSTGAFHRQAVAEALASSRSERRRAAWSTIGNFAGVAAGNQVARGIRATAHTYREFDKEARATAAFGNYSAAEMDQIVSMAIHKSAGTRFNDIQWLEGAKALGGRGVKAGPAMGILSEAANLGQAMGTSLPDAVALLEGGLFSFQRDLSTRDSAAREARRSADMQAAAAKASGMSADDLKLLYKTGAVGSNLAKIMEPWLLTFGALGKKVNIGGDEMGTAFRTMTARLLAPTQKGREALAAYGINYSQFQRMPARLDVGNFEAMIAQQYGVKLDAGARAKVGAAFSDPAVFGNATQYALAMAGALQGQVGISNAKDRAKVVKSAERFRQFNAKEVDASGLLMHIMESVRGGNLSLANAVFTEKQGGRVMAALRDPEVWESMVKTIGGAPGGTAERIATQRMGGFDGAVARFENAIKNLETAFGRAVDNDGKGGLLTGGVNTVAGLIQSFAELSSKSHIAAGTLSVLGGSAMAVKGAFGLINDLTGGNGPAAALTLSAGALGRSAAALTLAAERLALASGVPKPWPSVIPAGPVPLAAPAWVPGGMLSGLGLASIAGVTYALGAGISNGIANYYPTSSNEQLDIRQRIFALEDRIRETMAKSKMPEHAENLVAPLRLEVQELKNRLGPNLPQFSRNQPGGPLNLGGENGSFPRFAQGFPPLQGEVRGEAKVNVEVAVKASPQLLATIEKIERGLIDLRGSISEAYNTRVGGTGTQNP